jgi:hypothetical protein
LTADDALLKDSLDRAKPALAIDGLVADCDGALPRRLVGHLWKAEQDLRARRFHQDVDALIQKLSDILGADVAASSGGRTAERLQASVGPADAHTFDFQAMSSMLRKVAPSGTLGAARRHRIEDALTMLRDQRFFSKTGDGYSFVFTSASAARDAFWTRRVQMDDLIRAVDVARLEIEGLYREDTHDALLAKASPGADHEATNRFPDYLVQIDADQLDAQESSAIVDGLAAGLPLKVLVHTDDVLDSAPFGATHFGFGLRGRQLVNVAIGLNDVYVLQAPGSHLLKLSQDLQTGLRYQGPVVFSVFSGASGHAGDLPPYLVAAAALESRAFPAFVYNPAGGDDWASRFSLSANPQIAADWPVHRFTYETSDHQTAADDLAFTLVDFVACDARYAGHFAKVDRTAWHDRLISVQDALAPAKPPQWDRVPYLPMVDPSHRMGKVLVEDVLMREARRCRDLWHSLQELGGVHNSHARRLLERERAKEREAPPAEPPAIPAQKPVPEASIAAAALSTAGSPADARSPGDPYIETPRCSTCNECTQINSRMFAYNENKQAFIAHPDAGTYRQLVEAAESCQVSIIHPGQPRNPNEPGLEELLKRAEAFL